jgi:hypothetical protein
VHGASLAVREALEALWQQSLDTWLKFLASRIESQDKMTFLKVSALCFIASFPDSQDFAAVRVV